MFQASFNIIVKKFLIGTRKKHFSNRREESTSIAALVCFKLRYSILWKFSLENNKNFSVKINSKPENCVGWRIAFLSRPLSNKEVIGSTKVKLGDFLRPNIYYKTQMKVIFTECFSLISEFRLLIQHGV